MTRSYVSTLFLTASIGLLGACAEDGDSARDVHSTNSAELGSIELEAACDTNSVYSLDGYDLSATTAVTTNPGVFDVSVTAGEGRTLQELRLWFGAPGTIPLVGGAPDFSQFPHVYAVNGTTFQAQFPQPLEVACGAELKVAVYVAVEGGSVSQWEEMYIYLVTCCEDAEAGCTLTQGYWKNHNRFERGNRSVAWPIDERTALCGRTWLDILRTPTRGDAWMILAHQWIAAELNVANGASTTREVRDALAAGQTLLAACRVAEADRALAIGASEVLDAYNNGDLGPGHCD